MIIYGLSTCSDCKKARQAIEATGREVTFRDVRAEPLDEAELATLISEFGDRLVERNTTDYRALNDWLKNSEAEAQITAKPKVMARPIIHDGDAFHLGWSEAVQRAVLG
jgi:arsenate reductase-like glutaredoxin family protein